MEKKKTHHLDFFRSGVLCDDFGMMLLWRTCPAQLSLEKQHRGTARDSAGQCCPAPVPHSFLCKNEHRGTARDSAGQTVPHLSRKISACYAVRGTPHTLWPL